MFAVYSYIAPIVTEVGTLPKSGASRSSCWRSALGMVVGTWLAGELADWSVFCALGSSLGIVAVLLVRRGAPYGWWAAPAGVHRSPRWVRSWW